MRPTVHAGTLLLLVSCGPLQAQSLARRIADVRNGTIHLSFSARPGVCGDGQHNISLRHDAGEWESACEEGPVRIAIDRRDGKSTALRAYVGGQWRGAGAVDLGPVPVREATDWLLQVAASGEETAEDAVFPATLADSVELWPALLRLARDDDASTKVRRTATFWLGQAAGDAATQGLDSIVGDPRGDRDVREAAVFALSQRPRDEGVPVLIRVVQTNRDPEIRRKALFWLGQSGDPRALALFEDLLSAGR
jgi:HEAT repeats